MFTVYSHPTRSLTSFAKKFFRASFLTSGERKRVEECSEQLIEKRGWDKDENQCNDLTKSEKNRWNADRISVDVKGRSWVGGIHT